VKAQLSALSRKHFIRPMTSAGSETRYRFEHHLVRDTVYNGLLKRARATMHVEFVKWADQVNAESDRGQEFEAILGYHLEQAYKYLGELGPIDQTGAALGRDGARRLGSAARRALARGDNHAASSLFQRAAALLPVEDAERLDLLPDLAEALGGLGRFGDARAILKEARELAERAGNERIAASARVISTFVRLYSRETDGDTEDPLDMVERLRPALERDGAYSELANAWRVVLTVHAVAGRISQASEAAQQALKCAQLAKNDRLAARVALSLASIALFGPMPVEDAISLCERTIQQGLSDRVVEASLLCTLSSLRAMHGELPVARGLLQQGRKMLDDLGGGARVAYTGIHMGIVELHGGDLKIAEEQMQRDVEALDSLGERYHLPAIAVLLARIIREQGRDADAKPLLEMARRLSAPNDVSAQAVWRAVLAPIVARQGEVDEALQLASTAVEMFKKAESPGFEADALCELATVLSLAGKTDEAHEALMQAAELYRSKGNVVALSRLQAQRDSNKGKGSAESPTPSL
jgi:tetratricopeptide (TPR) repeat protein